jgi:hypothetical protein
VKQGHAGRGHVVEEAAAKTFIAYHKEGRDVVALTRTVTRLKPSI